MTGGDPEKPRGPWFDGARYMQEEAARICENHFPPSNQISIIAMRHVAKSIAAAIRARALSPPDFVKDVEEED